MRTLPAEEFEVVALEKTFEGPIVNPATGATSRSFIPRRKVDGIVRQDGQYFLLEHKTASQIDASYLESGCGPISDHPLRLVPGADPRHHGQRHHLATSWSKAKLRQAKVKLKPNSSPPGELIAKSKTGKSSAKRKLPEDDDTFSSGSRRKYLEPGMFHRGGALHLPRPVRGTAGGAVGTLQRPCSTPVGATPSTATRYCFQYGRPCAYFQLCRSGGNPNVIETISHGSPRTKSCGTEP